MPVWMTWTCTAGADLRADRGCRGVSACGKVIAATLIACARAIRPVSPRPTRRRAATTVSAPGSPRRRFADGLAEIGRDLAYSKTLTEVGGRDPERAELYSRVWSTLGSVQPGVLEAATRGSAAAAQRRETSPSEVAVQLRHHYDPR